MKEIDLEKHVADCLSVSALQRGLPYGTIAHYRGLRWITPPRVEGFKVLLNTMPPARVVEIKRDILENSGAQTVTLSGSFSSVKGLEEEIGWNFSTSLTAGVTMSVGYESPIGLSAGVEVSVEAGIETGTSKTKTISTTRTALTAYELEVPPESQQEVQLVVSERQIKAPWEAVISFAGAMAEVEMEIESWLDVVLYEHHNQQGESFALRGNDWRKHLKNWGDRLSSLTVVGNGWVELFEHPNFKGRKQRFEVHNGRRNVDLVALGWNDIVSSVHSDVVARQTVKRLMPVADLIGPHDLTIPVDGWYEANGTEARVQVMESVKG